MRKLTALLVLVLFGYYLAPINAQDDARGHLMGPPDNCTHGQGTTWDATAKEWVCASLALGSGGSSVTTCGVPALTLSTASAAGDSGQAICTNSVLAIFDAGVPAALATTASTGGIAFSARRDHVHPYPPSLMAANGDLLTTTSDGSIITVTPNPSTRELDFSSDGFIGFITTSVDGIGFSAANGPVVFTSGTSAVLFGNNTPVGFFGTGGGWISHIFPDNTVDGLVDLGLAAPSQRFRDLRLTGGVFLKDTTHATNTVKLVASSSVPLTGSRTLTIDVQDADRTLKLPITVSALTSAAATPGDTLTLTSDGTDLTLTPSRAGANLKFNDQAAVTLAQLFDSTAGDRGLRVSGHAVIGEGNTLYTNPVEATILAIAEETDESPFSIGLSVHPTLKSDVGSGGIGTGGIETATYGLRLETGFESTDGLGTGEPFNLYGHRVNWTGNLGGAALVGFPEDIVAFDVNQIITMPAGSAAGIGEVVGFRVNNLAFTNVSVPDSYGIKIEATGPGTDKWAGMFGGDVQITGTNKLILGGTLAAKTTDTFYRSSANNLRWQINGADEMQISATALFPVTNGGLTLGQNANGWGSLALKDTAAANELFLQASNIGADRTITLDPSADATLTIDGSATLNDWFNQSVKTTADPTFNTVKLNDSDDSHQITLAATSNVTAARQISVVTGDADRTLTLPIGSTGANTNGSMWWGDGSDAFDTGDEVCPGQGLTCVTTYTPLGINQTCAFDHGVAGTYFYALCK